MREMKIRIESPTHCKYVQDALFAEGYSWHTDAPKSHYEPCTRTAKWIFAYDDGLLTWDHDADYGDGHTHEEYIWTPQQKFVKRADYFVAPATKAAPQHYKRPETKSDKVEQELLEKHLPPGNYSQVLFTSEGQIERKLTVKPPLGLKPKKLHDEERLIEIVDAMYRFVSAGKPIPAEWLQELNDLNNQLEGK